VTEREEEGVSSYWMILRKRGYWKVKEKAVGRILWRTRFGRVYIPFWKTDYGINK
jgi:hypothetical protein